MITWDTCKEDFRWDGSLRDIYVTPASLDDWRTIYPLLRSQSDIEIVTEAGMRDIPETLDGSFFADVRPTLRFRVFDGLRHGFATFFRALKKSDQETSWYMGNSVQMVKKHYAKSIPQSELDSFWQMMPAVVLAA